MTMEFIKPKGMEVLTFEDDEGDLDYVLQYKDGDTLRRIGLWFSTVEEIILNELWTWYAQPSTKEHMRDAIRTLIVEGYHDGMDATEYMTLLDADLARNRIKEEEEEEEEEDDND